MNYNEVFQLDKNSWFDFQLVYDQAISHFSSGSHFVEIGSWQGASAAYLALQIKNNNKDIQIYCVDTWLGDLNCSNSQRIIKTLSKSLYDTFLDNMKKLNISTIEQIYEPFSKSDIIIQRGDSYNQLSLFKDQSIDFIFIDGGHGEECVRKDIEISKQKIKPNGWIGGHDYTAPHIQQIVKENFKNVEGIETSRSNDKTLSSWLVKL